MANRFERIDNTAPIVDVAENTQPNVQYSNFDLNRKIVGQALPYAIIPIDVIETLPNSKVWLNYDVQVTFRNPSVRKMLNGWRVYLHSYYNRKSDLWEGWNNFITRGRSGTMNLKIPHIATRIKNSTGNYEYSPFTPMSLYNYLGYPSEIIAKETISGVTKTILDKRCGIIPANIVGSPTGKDTGLANYRSIEISALKAMMYQRLWRDKYSPKNLLQKNKNLFPDNEDHFILSYEADEVNRIKYEDEEAGGFVNVIPYYEKYVTMDDENIDLRLDCLRFRQFQGDRFTTSSPFEDMLRGEAPTLNITLDPSDLSITIPEQYGYGPLKIEHQVGGGTESYDVFNSRAEWVGNVLSNDTVNNTPYGALHYKYGGIDKNVADGDKLSVNITIPESEELAISGEPVTSTIKLSELRSLEVFTIFAERMARTNGDYNEMIKAQFGHNPKSDSREAIYIGGSYQDILSNSIYQTSENGETPLGTQVAQGISASYNKIGEFTADDYGYIMTVMTIVPETIYTTGISKLDTALSMEEQYYPIMNNLSAEAVLNKELYVSGNEETDNDVWGWAERFSEYKSRRSRACGLSELSSSDAPYDNALVMARRFNTSQNLNATFVTGIPSNVNLEVFTSNNEAPFDFVIRQDVNVNYPMPYATIPQGLGTRA